MTLPALPTLGSTSWYIYAQGVDTVVRTAAREPASSDKTYYVSVNGNDSNDGLSWGSALATLPMAFFKLSFGPGTIEVGAGTFSSTGMVPNFGQVIRGRSRLGTIISLSATGTLIDLTGVSQVRFESLGFQFASSSVTGTLVKLSNGFNCDFEDVSFVGQSVGAQVGVQLSNNAGDSQFVCCYFDTLGVAVQNDTTVNHFIACCFTSNATAAIQGGDSTGVDHKAGITVTDTTFRGTGTYYVNIAGTAQAWTLKGCWFDGGATTAIKVGTGTFGPWQFSLIECPAIAGQTTSLALNASDGTTLSDVVFADTGAHPTDLAITKANCPNGVLGVYKSLQGRNIAGQVPLTWQGSDNSFSFLDAAVGSSGSTVGQSIGGSFTTLTLSTVNSDPGGNFASNIYTVPSTGRYLCIGKVRITDSAGAVGAGLGVGVHTSNIDGPWFQWGVVPSATRRAVDYQRVSTFNAGDQLRLYTYYDNSGGTTTIATAALTIVRLL